MKLVTGIMLAASTSAFVLKPTFTSKTVASADISGMVGISQEPNMKNKLFDPLGFSEKNPSMVPFYREAELKHGMSVH